MDYNSKVYLQMQHTCVKHCTNTLLKAQLDPLENLCLNRCVNKYAEAIDFSMQQFKQTIYSQKVAHSKARGTRQIAAVNAIIKEMVKSSLFGK